MTKTTNTNPTDYIAIDVSKATLQIQDDQRTFAVDNDSEGHSKLRKHIKTRQNPLVVFEATGGYERGLCKFLRKEAIPLTMVNPARVRDFARSEGVRAKTDPIDTKMILAFAKSKALCAMETPSETCTKLAALAGIAPFNRDSGKFSGKRSIIGGRAKVRRCLYMATQSAANCNPIISAYVQRLSERGKPYKCAIVAAMRKLLLHIQSLIKNSKLSPC